MSRHVPEHITTSVVESDRLSGPCTYEREEKLTLQDLRHAVSICSSTGQLSRISAGDIAHQLHV